MSQFENKMVAVMNKSADPGTAMNALGHICMGFGATIGKEELQLVDYVDANGGVYPNISKMPFIILRANSNKIRNLITAAEQEGIRWAAFTDTMTIGTWDQQVARTKETTADDMTFFGIVLFGPWDTVTALTKKFSLWR